ncbi:hypothetical protein MMC26_004315 [Xylographa opegraphella]|nr:hypothetical protein [Xylographa opegraphella]
MDPLSMTVAITSLVMKCASIVKAAQDVRGRYKAATLTISSIATECVTVSTALSHLQNLAINDGSVDADVVNTLETVVIGCTLTISVLEEYILELITDKKVSNSADITSKWTTKVKFLWNEVEMRELLQQLRGHQASITLLLTVLRSKSEVETRDLLRRNHGSLKMMISRARSSREKKTKSIIEGSTIDLVDSQSVLSFAESSRSSTCFEFDDLVVNSKVYRQAMLRSIQKNASGDERNSDVELDPVLTDINAETTIPADALAATNRHVDLDLSTSEITTKPLSPGIAQEVSRTGSAFIPTEGRVDLNIPINDTVTNLSAPRIGTNGLNPFQDNIAWPSSSPFLLQPLQLPELSLIDPETMDRFGSFRLTETALGLPNAPIQDGEYPSQQLLPLPSPEPAQVEISGETQPSLVPARSNLPRSTRICGVCQRPLKGQWVRALGQTYHIECFRCRDCNQTVAEKFFPVDDEKGNGQSALCETDYFRRLDLLCYGCGEALRGSYLEACNRKYHEGHMTCSMCEFPIGREDTYYENEQKIMCHYHYATQGAEICAGCTTPIMKTFVETSRAGIVEFWHDECYELDKYWQVNLAASSYSCWKPSGLAVTEQARAELQKEEAMMEEKITNTLRILRNFRENTIDPKDVERLEMHSVKSATVIRQGHSPLSIRHSNVIFEKKGHTHADITISGKIIGDILVRNQAHRKRKDYRSNERARGAEALRSLGLVHLSKVAKAAGRRKGP